jgi:septum formation protein
MKLVLASKSPRRKMLLEQLGLQFDVIPSDADEREIKEENPEKLVKRLAELKVESVAGKLDGDNIVIGADTIVYFDGRIIGQPGNEEEAKATLRMLSGKTHEVFTGVCVINTKNNQKLLDAVKTYVTFRELSEKDIEKCLEHKIILGGAGSYTPEIYSRIFERLEGSFNNVVGLPTERLIPMLRSQGIDI